MREVVDHLQLRGVWLRDGANGRANEAGGVGDDQDAALQEALLSLMPHMSQAGGVHGEVRHKPVDPAQGATVTDVNAVADGTQDLGGSRPTGVVLQEGGPSPGTKLERALASRGFGHGEDWGPDGRVWPCRGARALEAEEGAEALVGIG